MFCLCLGLRVVSRGKLGASQVKPGLSLRRLVSQAAVQLRGLAKKNGRLGKLFRSQVRSAMG